jgi:hypothetical protein
MCCIVGGMGILGGLIRGRGGNLGDPRRADSICLNRLDGKLL